MLVFIIINGYGKLLSVVQKKIVHYTDNIGIGTGRRRFRPVLFLILDQI
jgi:hypothetical protein